MRAAEHNAKAPSAKTGIFATLRVASLRTNGTGAPSRRLAFASICASLIAALLALIAAPAFAAETHVFSSSFGEAGTGNGQLELRAHSGVAVNQETGSIYVGDTGNGRVEQFESSGVFARVFGALSEPTFIAVDNSISTSKGDVYVADSATNTVSKFEADGTAVSFWGSAGQLSFAEPLAGIAVDPAGNLWVYDESAQMREYSPAGTLTTEWNSGIGVTDAGIAVDSSDNLYVVRGSEATAEFSSSGSELKEEIDSQSTTGLAVDPANDDVYVGHSSEIARYDSSANRLETVGSPEPSGGSLSASQGLAVGAGHAVYVADAGNARVDVFPWVTLPDVTTGSASNVTATTATLNGHLDPDSIQLTDCHFDYTTGAAFQAHGFSGSQSAACVPDALSIPPDSNDHAVSADLTGLTPGTTYHFRLEAANANGTNFGADQTLTTLPVPLIDSASATNLTPSTADLNARINPEGLDTTYHFSYGTDTSYGTNVPVPPDADIGSGTSAVAVSQHLSGLTPATTYHFRVVAHNANGTATSPDHTFVYLPGTPGLPDGRAYEMVTPVDKAGSVVSPNSATMAADGLSLAGVSSGAFAGLSNDELPSQGVASYRFARTGSGWVTTPLQVFQGWRQSLGVSDSVWKPAGEFGVQYLSLRQADGSVSDVGPVWPPTFGSVSPSSYLVEGAASEAAHGIVFRTEEPTPKWPFDTTVTGASLYEYVGTNNSEPTLVGVSGSTGSTTLIGQCGTRLGASNRVQAGSKYNAVSESGQAVFFTADAGSSLSSAPTPTSTWASTSTCTNGGPTGTAPPADELYARLGGSQTVWVSEPQCTPASACNNLTTEPYTTEEASRAAGVVFEGASADGSKVFFTTTQQLTNGDTDATRDLYEYDFNAPAGQRLIQVSAGGSGDATPGSGAEVEGVSRISEDGSHVYFVAKGVLTTSPSPDAQGYGAHGEPVSSGAVAQAGAENLYVDDTETKQTAFIAELCSGAEMSGGVADAQCPSDLNSEPWNYGTNHNDQRLWSHGAAGGDERPVQSTPDGSSLVFTSYGDLTADDKSTARQVFQYDAQAGRLTRISIGEDGFNDGGNTNAGNPSSHASDTGNASVVTPSYAAPEEGWTRGGALARTMSDDGSYVFFQSPVGLTPAALNDVAIDSEGDLAQNVYEYHDGHVALISDGKDTSAIFRVSGNRQMSSVLLAGASASGSDVFFTTVDPLVPQDTDTQVDIYDARIGGGFPPPTAATPCGGETCKPPAPQPPAEPGAGSSTFSGPGNRPPSAKCRKGFVKKHGKCVKKHVRKHHKRRHHHRAANTNRRAGR